MQKLIYKLLRVTPAHVAFVRSRNLGIWRSGKEINQDQNGGVLSWPSISFEAFKSSLLLVASRINSPCWQSLVKCEFIKSQIFHSVGQRRSGNGLWRGRFRRTRALAIPVTYLIKCVHGKADADFVVIRKVCIPWQDIDKLYMLHNLYNVAIFSIYRTQIVFISLLKNQDDVCDTIFI